MNKYDVFVKYGLPGKGKTMGQTVRVEAESDSSAIRLAEAKLKNNSSYSKYEVSAERVKRL